MKIDGSFEVLPVPEPISHLLDGLDLRVKALADRIGDRVLKVGEDVVEVFVHHPGFFDNRLKAGVCRPEVPPFEVTMGPPAVCIASRDPGSSLDGPCPGSLEVQRFENREAFLVFLREIFPRIEPEIFGSRQGVIALLPETKCSFSYIVHGFPMRVIRW